MHKVVRLIWQHLMFILAYAIQTLHYRLHIECFLTVKLDHCMLEYIEFILYNVLPNAHTLSIFLAGLFIWIDEQNRCIHTVYISGVTYSLERAVIVLCACLPACLPVYAFHVHFLKHFFFFCDGNRCPIVVMAFMNA